MLRLLFCHTVVVKLIIPLSLYVSIIPQTICRYWLWHKRSLLLMLLSWAWPQHWAQRCYICQCQCPYTGQAAYLVIYTSVWSSLLGCLNCCNCLLKFLAVMLLLWVSIKKKPKSTISGQNNICLIILFPLQFTTNINTILWEKKMYIYTNVLPLLLCKYWELVHWDKQQMVQIFHSNVIVPLQKKRVYGHYR